MTRLIILTSYYLIITNGGNTKMEDNLKQLLVIEDFDIYANAYKKIGGDLFDVPTSFEEAETLLRNTEYPIIFMDYDFREWFSCDIDGQELLDRIKQGEYGEKNRNAIFIDISSNRELQGTSGHVEKARNGFCYGLDAVIGEYSPAHAKAIFDKF
jgi:hypothetical protein